MTTPNSHTPRVSSIIQLSGATIALFQGIALPLMDKPISFPIIGLVAGMMALDKAVRLDIKRRSNEAPE
mgnify:CR=1 FL=1